MENIKNETEYSKALNKVHSLMKKGENNITDNLF